MQFPRLIGVALVGILATSCSDVTTPTRVTALYVLESINGEPLPAMFPSQTGETATVFWATLNLDAAGNAAMAERRRRESSTFQQERTNTRLTDYEISGETIVIGPPCQPNILADCIPKRVGHMRGSTLTLSGEIGEPRTLVYEYRLATSD